MNTATKESTDVKAAVSTETHASSSTGTGTAAHALLEKSASKSQIPYALAKDHNNRDVLLDVDTYEAHDGSGDVVVEVASIPLTPPKSHTG